MGLRKKLRRMLKKQPVRADWGLTALEKLMARAAGKAKPGEMLVFVGDYSDHTILTENEYAEYLAHKAVPVSGDGELA